MKKRIGFVVILILIGVTAFFYNSSRKKLMIEDGENTSQEVSAVGSEEIDDVSIEEEVEDNKELRVDASVEKELSGNKLEDKEVVDEGAQDDTQSDDVEKGTEDVEEDAEAIEEGITEVPEDDKEEAVDSTQGNVEDDQTTPEKLYYVSGKNIYTSAGSQYRIKGISFGNNVWENPASAPLNHHDESSYKEIHDLGFNSVRFYINYKLFEDDSNPYTYKEEGFDWLEKNIEWAKAYNIKLIISMHLPQGGFVSTKNVSFWTGEGNKDRCIALWKEIANRYSDEDTVLGYGLMNEPYLPNYGDPSRSLNEYYNYIEELSKELRTVDENHILFVERPYGVVGNGYASYPWGDTGSFRTISDKDVVYEYHVYDSYSYTSQKIPYVKTFRDWYYEDENRIIMIGDRRLTDDFLLSDNLTANEIEPQWYEISGEGEYLGEGNAGYWYALFETETPNNNIALDQVDISIWNEERSAWESIYEYGFSITTACDGWDMGSGGGGTYAYGSGEGLNQDGAALVKDFSGSYKLYISDNNDNYFKLKNGTKYKIDIRLKADNEISVKIGIQSYYSEKLYIMNKEYLDYKLGQFISLGQQYNVPMYLGEFGVSRHIMDTEYRGEQWVEDIFELIEQYNLNYNYHDYHEENYGLYIENARTQKANYNQELMTIFQEEVD